MTTTTRTHADFARDFAPAVRRALLKRGIVIVGIVNLPGEGPLGYANGTRGYNLDDNGTHRIRVRAEVVAMAEAPIPTVTAEIDYTVDTRRGRHEITTRKTKAVHGTRATIGDAVARAEAKLRDVGAYSMTVRWPGDSV